MDKEKLFLQEMRNRGERVSSARLTLFGLLLHNGPIPATKLAELAQKSAIDTSTTYRNLHTFIRLGVAKYAMAGGAKLVELADVYAGHHHHFWCQECGDLIDFNSKGVELSLRKAAQALGVQLKSHQVELSGFCANCRPQTP